MLGSGVFAGVLDKKTAYTTKDMDGHAFGDEAPVSDHDDVSGGIEGDVAEGAPRPTRVDVGRRGERRRDLLGSEAVSIGRRAGWLGGRLDRVVARAAAS